MTQTLETPALADHFEALFTFDADPWRVRTRWYERRKRALTLAALPRERYRRAYEPGCAVGELTFELSKRCDAVVASDASEAAVHHARARLAGLSHVAVARAETPADWPAGAFDLIVVSELGYYLQDDALDWLVERARGSLAADGALLACHWRHPEPDFVRPGDAIHARIAQRAGEAGLRRVSHHLEDDFVLEVWARQDQAAGATR